MVVILEAEEWDDSVLGIQFAKAEANARAYDNNSESWGGSFEKVFLFIILLFFL